MDKVKQDKTLVFVTEHVLGKKNIGYDFHDVSTGEIKGFSAKEIGDILSDSRDSTIIRGWMMGENGPEIEDGYCYMQRFGVDGYKLAAAWMESDFSNAVYTLVGVDGDSYTVVNHRHGRTTMSGMELITRIKMGVPVNGARVNQEGDALFTWFDPEWDEWGKGTESTQPAESDAAPFDDGELCTPLEDNQEVMEQLTGEGAKAPRKRGKGK